MPRDALPELVPNWGEVAKTDPRVFCGLDLPIAGIAGDQQSALFGQTCFDEGDSKCTYGTGSFILTNTGSSLVRSDAGLLSTAAWRSPDGELTYALEGAIFVTGAAVQWLRDGLQIVGSAAETAAIASTVDDSEGVVFVPALTGLGAPHWDPHARGLIIGLTRGTTRAHIVRATLEAIAFEVRDVLETMPGLSSLRVDGGAAANDLLCQVQADQVGVPVERPKIVETTALGAAFLAGLGTGLWSSTDDLRETWQLERRFEPAGDRARADAAARALARGRRALEGLGVAAEPGRCRSGWSDDRPRSHLRRRRDRASLVGHVAKRRSGRTSLRQLELGHRRLRRAARAASAVETSWRPTRRPRGRRRAARRRRPGRTPARPAGAGARRSPPAPGGSAPPARPRPLRPRSSASVASSTSACAASRRSCAAASFLAWPRPGRAPRAGRVAVAAPARRARSG